MKKHDIAHSIIVALIFTCLLVLLLLAEPGAGFENSPIATAFLETIFEVSIFGFTVYLISLVVLLLVCFVINLFIDEGNNTYDLLSDDLHNFVLIAVCIYCLAGAFGFISIPGGIMF